MHFLDAMSAALMGRSDFSLKVEPTGIDRVDGGAVCGGFGGEGDRPDGGPE